MLDTQDSESASAPPPSQFVEIGDGAFYKGDCIRVMRELLDQGFENTFDAVVTDPPYHLTSIVKRFGGKNAVPNKFGTDGAFQRASAGFMGKAWDGGDVAFQAETWELALRLLKPGGHLAAFGGSRTYHRMACAIEDAGFEIRDGLAWVYGSGFPKSHNVSLAIDKAAGAEREIVGSKLGLPGYSLKANDTDSHARRAYGRFTDAESECAITAPATEAAKQWAGYGTALKPAIEPIVLARKPLEGTVAANTLKWGVGGINIDGCRVGVDPERDDPRLGGKGTWGTTSMAANVYGDFAGREVGSSPLGRWPANLVHDNSPAVLEAFAAFGERGGGPSAKSTRGKLNGTGAHDWGFEGVGQPIGFGDTGTAARFFAACDWTPEEADDLAFYYAPKAGKAERAGSKHPTVKNLNLMKWLTRLVCAPGGVILDPFAGTGTTLEAAILEGRKAVGIELTPEYHGDIERRLLRARQQ